MKRILLILFWLAISFTIVRGIAGKSSILLTFSCYYVAWFVLIWLMGKIVRNDEIKRSSKLLVTALILSLVSGELILKYIVKLNLSYIEANGGWQYESQYKQIPFKLFVRKYIKGDTAPFIYTNTPYQTRIQAGPDFSYVHTYNSLGLRDKEPAADTSAYTIIGLGDSFTEGIGSPADSTWLKQLEKKLRQKRRLQAINAINAGVSGSDPFFEYALLNQRLLQYKPNVVVLCINQSDIMDVATRGGNERFNNYNFLATNGPWWEFFYSFSYIFRAVAHSIFNINFLLLAPRQYELAENIASKKIEVLLNSYKKLALQNNFRLVVVLTPLQWELKNKTFLLKSLSENCAKDSGLLVIDLYKEYLQRQQRDSFAINSIYWPTDLHHNPTGYNLLASIVAEKIAPDTVLLPTAK